MPPVREVGAADGPGVSVTSLVAAIDIPQFVFAFTEIVPDVVLDVTAIVLVVEGPVQPDGKVQV